jgi:hypothetical protein
MLVGSCQLCSTVYHAVSATLLRQLELFCTLPSPLVLHHLQCIVPTGPAGVAARLLALLHPGCAALHSTALPHPG